MNLFGIKFEVKNKPVLDSGFVPIHKFNQAFLQDAKKPVKIAVERDNNCVYVYDTFVREDAKYFEANKFYIERLVKSILWVVGGFKVTICGDKILADYIKQTYCMGGAREFDAKTMSRVYEKGFIVEYSENDKAPMPHETSKTIGRNLDGCRIGFDAGGSDRKVSAVVDGQSIYSEEVVWHPKTEANPEYHYNEIVKAFKTAAEKMPRVDAIGISSAGIYINNRAMIASLFIKVPEDGFNKYVKDIYIRAAKEIGNVPMEVANDGDVTALAGAMSLGDTNILGIAMGTSEAGGYVDSAGNVKGWLNELAFVPCDASKDACLDEWSGDIGCGVKYFSQDAAIKLAPKLFIKFDENLSPGEKLSIIQKQEETEQIFETIGVYLGHTLPYYGTFYDIKHVLLMGRVTSGTGGDIIVKFANKVMKEEYPDFYKKINLQLPDEKSRRVGQSIAAASLPKIHKT